MPPFLEWLDAFAAGFYTLFAAIQLDLWRRRPERTSHAWLAGASLGALTVDVTGMALRRLGEHGGLEIANHFGVAVSTVCLYELVVSLGRLPVGRSLRWLELAVLLSALIPAANGSHPITNGVALALCAVLLLAATLRAIRAGSDGDREARSIGRAFLALTTLLLLDLLMSVGWLPAVPGLPVLGFGLLFLAASGSLNERVEREHRELTDLRRQLEQRVEERTLALSEANERLAEVSRTDELTGVPNRRAFIAAAGQELARAQRSGRSPSLVMLDLDHFKAINDCHGHAAGDAVLRAVADTLRRSLRGQDVVARWGGEEFILLLPETDLGGAAHVAEAIRQALAGLAVTFDGTSLTVTGSLGVARLPAGGSLDDAAARADHALYRAKELGRNRVEVAGGVAPGGEVVAPKSAAVQLGAE
jgi:diguanylate cyclase (GGDEF)-like protein